MRERLLKPHRIIPNTLYVQRDADRQLKSILDDMASPGYVLVSRQMGKTNLLLYAKRNYETATDVFVYVDLSNSFKTEAECFRNIINKTVDTNKDLLGHLKEQITEIRKQELPSHIEHLEELRLLLKIIEGKLVIILDEIDALTRSNFSDRIFSQIRSIYFDRSSYSELNKLTYILSGVVEPSEIIKDPKISPFNIGQKIFLDDFSYSEHIDFFKKANLLMEETILQRVFYWANGNPRITYDICSEIELLLVNNQLVDIKVVDNVVNKLYLRDFDKAPVDHIRELVEKDKSIRDAITIIRYNKGSEIEDSVKKRLYLSGIISSDFTSKNLQIKNRIIDQSLSEKWLKLVDKSGKNIQEQIIESIAKRDFSKTVDIYESEADTEFDPASLYHVASAYNSLGLYEKSIEVLKGVDFDIEYERKNYIETKYLLALSYSKINNSTEAVRILTEIIELDKLGKYFYPSKLLLAEILKDQNDGKEIDKVLQVFEEVINNFNQIASAFDEAYATDLKTSALLSSGNLLEKAGRKEDARQKYLSASDVSSAEIKPLIQFALYNLEDNKEKKEVALEKLIEFILENKLYPKDQALTLKSFNVQIFYSILKEAFRILPQKVKKVYSFLNESDGDNSSMPTLFEMGYLATSNNNLALATSIFEYIIIQNKSNLSSDLKQTIFRFLARSTNPYNEVIRRLGEPYFFLLLSNPHLEVSNEDLDLLLGLASQKIHNQDLDEAQQIITYLKDNFSKFEGALISSQYIFEFFEIQILQARNLDNLAKSRSILLNKQLSELSTSEVAANPILNSSFSEIKRILGDYVQIPEFLTSNSQVNNNKLSDSSRVDVKYRTGSIVRKVKLKKVKKDIDRGNCQVIKVY